MEPSIAVLKVGDRISWIATGKVARVYGMAGKKVTATIVGERTIDDEQYFETTHAYGPPELQHLVPTSKATKEDPK